MGPDERLGELITDSGDRLLRLAYQLTHDRSTAEDVVQEALVNVYRMLRRHRVDDMVAYARRCVLNEFLRRRRLRSATEIVTDVLPDDASVEDASVVDRDALWRALGGLPPRQRAVLVLRFYEDLPDAQIAGLIGAKEPTVRSLAARGLATLRRDEITETLR